MQLAALVLASHLLAGAPEAEGVGERAPASFEIVWERDGPLFRGVPVNATIRALDGSGRTLERFAGRAKIEGVRAEGRRIDVSGPFRAGELRLQGVEVPSGTIGIRLGAVSAESRRRVLPGFLTLLPPLLAIVLAIATRQVLLALFCGVWVGALILADFDPLGAFLRSADTYLVGALADPGHASILLFSLTLAGLVGIVTATGGVRGIVQVVSRIARGSRSGQVATWLLGLLIFFDDYANCLIVGNTMRPFTDRVRVSREKLSFIVDATAAPIATIGVISTWTAYQVGLLADHLPHVPAATREPYLYFLQSIPSSFYSFLMILAVLLVALTLKDVGPMRKAEARSRKTGAVLRKGAEPLTDESLDRLGDSPDIRPRWYNAAVPVACVVAFTVAGLLATGLESLQSRQEEARGLRDIIAAADAYRSLLWAALGASVVAGAMALLEGFRAAVVVASWVSGVRSLVLAAMILLLAWSISDVCQNLDTGVYVVAATRDLLSPRVMPCLAFLTAGAIAFSTGTSYGTMGILIPILFPLAYALSSDGGLAPVAAERIGLGTLAAILGGSVFGDHCSPISDTTVLSSMASGADHIDHVRTQLPYAALVAAICVPCYLLLGFGVAPGWVLAGGAACLCGLFFLLAKR